MFSPVLSLKMGLGVNHVHRYWRDFGRRQIVTLVERCRTDIFVDVVWLRTSLTIPTSPTTKDRDSFVSTHNYTKNVKGNVCGRWLEVRGGVLCVCMLGRTRTWPTQRLDPDLPFTEGLGFENTYPFIESSVISLTYNLLRSFVAGPRCEVRKRVLSVNQTSPR